MPAQRVNIHFPKNIPVLLILVVDFGCHPLAEVFVGFRCDVLFVLQSVPSTAMACCALLTVSAVMTKTQKLLAAFAIRDDRVPPAKSVRFV